MTYYSLIFFIANAFKVHLFAGQVKIVSHSSSRTSAIFKYFCPLSHQRYILDSFGTVPFEIVQAPDLFMASDPAEHNKDMLLFNW